MENTKRLIVKHGEDAFSANLKRVGRTSANRRMHNRSYSRFTIILSCNWNNGVARNVCAHALFYAPSIIVCSSLQHKESPLCARTSAGTRTRNYASLFRLPFLKKEVRILYANEICWLLSKIRYFCVWVVRKRYVRMWRRLLICSGIVKRFCTMLKFYVL